VWSCPAGTALRYPARYLFAFLANHGMLSVSGSPPWRTVTGGSRCYVERAAQRLACVRLGTPVRAARRYPDGADVRDASGRAHQFDAVVIATHPDQALALLVPATRAEQAVLGAFGPLAAGHLLASGQRRKIDALPDRAGVGPGRRLLEVGTGWGELAIRAARRGATVVTVTISREQQALAARRVAEAGLAGRVRVELRDYRDLVGTFDAICSCEMLEAGPAGPVMVLGAAVWLGGFAFESIGDWQLARFKADPGNHGLIMDRGLWRYTRHPNYFGDFCMWWGLFLIALGSRAELPTVAGPLLMTYILIRGTGQRLTDRRMAATRPQYAEYAARTSGFIPRPPRRSH
jgi:protein-S-isoprenylcysteine O-methyltransferase Ste14